MAGTSSRQLPRISRWGWTWVTWDRRSRPISLSKSGSPSRKSSDGRIVCEVLDTDRFGNVRLNVRRAHLVAGALDESPQLEISTSGSSARAHRIASYGQVEPGAYGILVDAWEWMAVIRFEASAAADLGVQPGDPVWLTTA